MMVCGLPHVLVAARYVLVVACLFTHLNIKTLIHIQWLRQMVEVLWLMVYD